MGTNLAIRCACGAVQGVVRDVSAKVGNHVVCHCDDCQAFAHFLGRAAEALDEHGGTEIFQMSPARLSFTAGADRLACMRLSPKGLLRWYAGCCNTPLGNTLPTNGLPFVGVIHACIERPPGDSSLDGALGPIQVRAFRRFAKGDPATIPSDNASMLLLAPRFAGHMLKWKLSGDGRRSPFFAGYTGRPVAEPRVLGEAERAELRQAVLRR